MADYFPKLFLIIGMKVRDSKFQIIVKIVLLRAVLNYLLYSWKIYILLKHF